MSLRFFGEQSSRNKKYCVLAPQANEWRWVFVDHRDTFRNTSGHGNIYAGQMVGSDI
jgi:hypothetical protein